MKKLIALVICAVMVLSVIPVMTLTASAAVEGDWTTYRRPKDYKEPAEGEEPSYTPAPGYTYTSEGFQTVSPDFSECNPFFTVQSKDKQSLKDGIHMEFRIDEFSYGGEGGFADHWISVSLWNTANVSPGGTDHGAGWLCLIRGAGEGATATVESWLTTEKDEEAGVAGNFAPGGAGSSAKPGLDDAGRELYTLDVNWTGSAYEIKINNEMVGGSTSTVTKFLENLDASGDFYIGVTFHTGARGGVAGMTILNFNGSVPTGDDSKPADENVNLPPADIFPADSVPENMPCLLFDATKSSFNSDPQGTNVSLDPQGDNSYHCTAGSDSVYFSWGIRRSLSYAADDFPVVALMLRNYNGNGGTLWYCAGEVYGAQNDCVAPWTTYDDENIFYDVGDDEYVLVVVDLSYQWFDRIHALRFDFACSDTTDPEEAEWDVMWAGIFRSVEEAHAYAENLMGPVETPTEAPGDVTEAPDNNETAATPTESSEVTTPATEAVTDAKTEAATKAENTTNAATEAETKAAENTGCASVIGGAVAVLFASMAAAVALKKKH